MVTETLVRSLRLVWFSVWGTIMLKIQSQMSCMCADVQLEGQWLQHYTHVVRLHTIYFLLWGFYADWQTKRWDEWNREESRCSLSRKKLIDLHEIMLKILERQRQPLTRKEQCQYISKVWYTYREYMYVYIYFIGSFPTEWNEPCCIGLGIVMYLECRKYILCNLIIVCM